MKNLNPHAGYSQITTGTFYVPRGLIVDLIRNKKLKTNELSFYLLAILSADWNAGEHRYGLIRHNLKDLSQILKIPNSTFTENLNKLIDKGLLSKHSNAIRVNNFDYFQKAKAYKSKNQNNEILEQLKEIPKKDCEIPESQSDISENISIKLSDSFNVSFKVGNNLSDNDRYQYTQSEWAKIRLQDPGLPSWEDKLLIDESVREATPIKPFHQQVGEALY